MRPAPFLSTQKVLIEEKSFISRGTPGPRRVGLTSPPFRELECDNAESAHFVTNAGIQRGANANEVVGNVKRKRLPLF